MLDSHCANGHVARAGVPAYQQISEQLAEEISQHVWKSGCTLPNERKLADRFSVSIGTVRRAITALQRQGLVAKMQGLGTFVCPPQLELPAAYARAEPFELLDSTNPGHEASKLTSELVTLQLVQASDEESRALGIETGDFMWLIEVQHLLNTQVIAFEQLCVSKRVFPNLSIEMLKSTKTNLYRLASEVFQMRIGQMTDEVSVRSMDSRVASLFNKTEDSPSLRVFRITHSMDNTPIEKREVWLDPSYAHYKAKPELS
jgi:GntR family transcriptional regulator